ncbi:hypothetical protein SME06J_42250 [Serratia marcescens]|nr:hypothetical protein SME06J_42250 [Serratia marcescens]
MISLSIGDLNSLQFESNIQGRIVLNVENGRVKCNALLSTDNFIGTVEEFTAVAKRCGVGFQAITVPNEFTGKILVTARNGIVTSQDQLSDKHHVSTLTAFLEIAQQAGFKIITPVTER